MGLDPALSQPFPPSSHGAARKTPGSSRTEARGTQAWDSGRNTKNKEAASTAGRKLSTLLLSGGKAPRKAPAIHPPWTKARVRPADDGGRKRGGVLERRGGGGVGLFENGEAGMRESREGTRDREVESRWKSTRNGVNHEARNGERGEEHRGMSTNCCHSLDGGVLTNGRYFQTGKPKQKLSKPLGLISGARRLQGAARVGSEDCSGARGWPGGGRACSRTHAPVGGRSVSAWVSQRDRVSAGRRGRDNSESVVWWNRATAHPRSGSETGGTASSSELSSSVESSTNLSTTRPEATESGSETEKQDWETAEEETADAELERQYRSEAEQEREAGLDGEVRSEPSESVAASSSVNGEGGNSSAKETNMKSGAAPPSSPPTRSSQKSTEEEVEEDEEVRNVLSLTLASQASSSKKPDTGLAGTKDLSPIIEDTEDEEEDKGEDEEAGDLGNELAD